MLQQWCNWRSVSTATAALSRSAEAYHTTTTKPVLTARWLFNHTLKHHTSKGWKVPVPAICSSGFNTRHQVDEVASWHTIQWIYNRETAKPKDKPRGGNLTNCLLCDQNQTRSPRKINLHGLHYKPRQHLSHRRLSTHTTTLPQTCRKLRISCSRLMGLSPVRSGQQTRLLPALSTCTARHLLRPNAGNMGQHSSPQNNSCSCCDTSMPKHSCSMIQQYPTDRNSVTMRG